MSTNIVHFLKHVSLQYTRFICHPNCLWCFLDNTLAICGTLFSSRTHCCWVSLELFYWLIIKIKMYIWKFIAREQLGPDPVSTRGYVVMTRAVFVHLWKSRAYPPLVFWLHWWKCVEGDGVVWHIPGKSVNDLSCVILFIYLFQVDHC